MSRWSSDELTTLRALSKTTHAVPTFGIPGRTPQSCYVAMKRRGIARPGRDASDGRKVKWSRSEKQRVRALALSGTPHNEIAIEGKTTNAVYELLRELGFIGRWKKSELARLKKLAKSAISVDEITLPGRTPEQISHQLVWMGIHPGTRPLTDAELEELRILAETGVPQREWKLPGRTRTFLAGEARRRGFRRKKKEKAETGPPKPKWQDEEVELLKAELAKGLAPSEMTIAGRSAASIAGKARRLRIVGDGIVRAEWPAEDIARLKKLARAGKSAADLASENAFPGRSRTAIQKQLGKHKLVSKKRSRLARAAVRMDEATLATFHEYLTLYGRTNTPEQLVIAWNEKMTPKVTHGRVVYHLTQLKIKPSQTEVRRMPYSRKKASNSQKARSRRETRRRKR